MQKKDGKVKIWRDNQTNYKKKSKGKRKEGQGES